MRRNFLTLAVVGLLGAFLASDASACCHKKKACAPVACAPAPAPVVECLPPPPPVVECAPAPVVCAPVKKKCGFKMPKLGCFKKKACAPAPAC